MLSSGCLSLIAESGTKAASQPGTAVIAESRGFAQPQGETATVFPLSITSFICSLSSAKPELFAFSGFAAGTGAGTGSALGACKPAKSLSSSVENM